MKGLSRIADELDRTSDAIIVEALGKQYPQEGKLWNKYGDEGKAKSLRDSRYNLSYLLAALRADDPAILADYISWLVGLFDSLGFGPGIALTTFRFLGAVAAVAISCQDAELLLPFIDTAIDLARAPATEAEPAKAVAADKPDLLCLSATMPWHVQDLKATINAVRNIPGLDSLPILAGGRPFAISPELWRSVGADGTAATAQEALELAGRLLKRVA